MSAFDNNTQSGPTTDDLLAQILADQQAARAEVQELRAKLDAQKPPTPAPTQVIQSPEEARAARLAEVAKYPFYCPGCGKLSNYPRECVGSGASPHPAIEVVSTDELHPNADPANHTPAPPSLVG
jgi:hypothetical protein